MNIRNLSKLIGTDFSCKNFRKELYFATPDEYTVRVLSACAISLRYRTDRRRYPAGPSRLLSEDDLHPGRDEETLIPVNERVSPI